MREDGVRTLDDGGDDTTARTSLTRLHPIFGEVVAVQFAGASAVAAGALFQFTEATPLEAVEYLAAHGVETRNPYGRPDRNGTMAGA